mgnify:CR=1 FL=1
MNAGLVERINALVKPGDEVWCFGDFSLNWQGAEMVKLLNGTWYLFPGNHDKCHSVMHKNKEEKKANTMKKYSDMGFIVMPEYYSTVLKHEGEEIAAQICHFPFKEDHGNFEEQPRYQKLRPVPTMLTQILLHGHVHNSWKSRHFWYEEEKRFIPQINLGVDVWDWRPVSEQELFEFCKKELDEAAQLSQAMNEETPHEGT